MTDTNLLSDNWLRRAQQLSPYYRERLKWPIPGGWPADVASAEFAQRVAAFQKQHGALTIDGILGPKTAEAIKGATFAPPADDYLVAGGQRIAVPFPVVTWDEPGGMSFYGRGGWTKRRDPSGKGIDLCVLHWDGCTSARQCFHVLLERGLSVHLMLDGDGTVYQALDLAEARAWHAGDVNERSIGVEIQNPVEVHRNQWQKPPRPVVVTPGVNGAGSRQHLDFYDVQKQRVVELVEVLCAHFGIPRQLPVGGGGDVLRTLAPAGFRGVCGHYHVSTSKPDPGLTLWPALKASFGEPPPTYTTPRRDAVA